MVKKGERRALMASSTVGSSIQVARGSGNNGWSARSLFATGGSLYIAAQNDGGSPSVRMFRSVDDGATWAEQDAVNAPAANSAVSSYSAVLRDGTTTIVTARFASGTRMRVREFDTATNTWAGADLAGADVSNFGNGPSPLHIVANANQTVLQYTSSSDTADPSQGRYTGGSWTATNILANNSVDRSIHVDTVSGTGFHQRFYYSAESGTFSVRSLVDNGTTLGTPVNVDSSAAATEASHAPAIFEPYAVLGTNYVTAAYIDADNTINERECSLDVTSASIGLGTQRQVTASTAYAGGQLSTCKYNGKRYVFAAKADGTGIGYWVDEGAGWGERHNLVVGGPDIRLSQALPIEGSGIYMVYNREGDVYGGRAVDGPEGPIPEEITEFFYAQII